MKTIAEQLHEAIDQLEAEINQHGFCNLTFKFRNGEFYTFEKQLTINNNELKILAMK
jgi:hypothetical protein